MQLGFPDDAPPAKAISERFFAAGFFATGPAFVRARAGRRLAPPRSRA